MTYKIKTTIAVGDRVGYRVAWLRSCGMAHSDWSRLRGTVVELKPFGSARDGRQLARVDWGDGEEPMSILASNLAKPGTLAFTSEDH